MKKTADAFWLLYPSNEMKLGHNSAKSTLAAVLFAAEFRFHGLAGFTSGTCQHHTNAGSADPKCLPYF